MPSGERRVGTAHLTDPRAPSIAYDEAVASGRNVNPARTMSRPVVWLLATLAAAMLYLATAHRGLAWGDSGNAQLRVLLGHYYDRQDLSRSHLPYYAVADLTATLGISPANAATLVSALAGAVTLGNLAWWLTYFVRSRLVLACGVTILTLSHALWSQATVAEVMTFSTMALTFELALVTAFAQSSRRTYLLAAVVVNGIGFSAHNLAMLTWPAYVAYFLADRHALGRQRLRTVLLGVVGWLLGSAPWWALLWAATNRSGDFSNALYEMLAGRYAGHVFNLLPTPRALLKLAAYTLYSFPTPLLLAVFIGIPRLRRIVPPLRWYLLVAFLCFLVFALRYSVPDQHVFLLHSYVFGILAVAVGVEAKVLSKASRFGPKVFLIACTLLSPLVYVVVPHVLRTRFPATTIIPQRSVRYRDPFDWFLKPWRLGDSGAERFAREVLAELPANTVLVLDSTQMPPLLYLQSAEDLRRDVRIVGAACFQPWFTASFDLASGAREQAIREGRLFTVTDVPQELNVLIRSYAFIPQGRLFRVAPHE